MATKSVQVFCNKLQYLYLVEDSVISKNTSYTRHCYNTANVQVPTTRLPRSRGSGGLVTVNLYIVIRCCDVGPMYSPSSVARHHAVRAESRTDEKSRFESRIFSETHLFSCPRFSGILIIQRFAKRVNIIISYTRTRTCIIYYNIL